MCLQYYLKTKEKLTGGAKRWAAKFKTKHRSEPETETRTEQDQKSDIDQTRREGNEETDDVNTKRKNRQINHYGQKRRTGRPS